MKFLIESKSKDMLGIEPREKAQMLFLFIIKTKWLLYNEKPVKI